MTGPAGHDAQPLRPASTPFTPAEQAVIDDWMPADVAVPPIALFRLLARAPELATAVRPMATHLLRGSRVPAADRETVILRTTAMAGSEYEWGIHAALFAPPAGLQPTTIAALSTPGSVTPRQGDDWIPLLADAVDQLLESSCLHPQTLQGLSARYDDAQILELILLCGWYRTIACLTRSGQLPLETWAARLPD